MSPVPSCVFMLLPQAKSAGQLPTSAAPTSAGTQAAAPKQTWQQRLRSFWQQHPTLALCCMALFLVLAAVILGVAIGISAKNRGKFPWWGKGELGATNRQNTSYYSSGADCLRHVVGGQARTATGHYCCCCCFACPWWGPGGPKQLPLPPQITILLMVALTPVLPLLLLMLLRCWQ